MINTTSLKICFKDTSYFSFYPLLNKKMFWSPTIFTLQCCNIVTIYTIKTNYYLIAFHQRFCEKFCDCIDNHKKIRPPGVHGRRGRCEPNFWRTQTDFQNNLVTQRLEQIAIILLFAEMVLLPWNCIAWKAHENWDFVAGFGAILAKIRYHSQWVETMQQKPGKLRHHILDFQFPWIKRYF